MLFEIPNLILDTGFIRVCLPLVLTHPVLQQPSVISKDPLPSWEKKASGMIK